MSILSLRAKQIYTLYTTILDRFADTEGFNYNVDSPADLRTIVSSITGSAEATGRPISTNSNDSDFIDDLYWGVLQRAADTNGKNFWLELLTREVAPLTRADVVFALISSSEYVDRVAPTMVSVDLDSSQVYLAPSSTQAQVIGLYQGVLGRLPDYAGYVYNTNIAVASGTIQPIINAMVGSAEFSANYGTPSAISANEINKSKILYTTDSLGRNNNIM